MTKDLMPTYRGTYELNVASPILRQRLKRMLAVQLCFHPYKNPKVTASWFSDLLRAEFDYVTDEPDPTAMDMRGVLLTHIGRLFTGQDGVPYLKRDRVLGPLKWDRYRWEGEYEWQPGRIVWFSFWADYSQSVISRLRRWLIGPWFPRVPAASARRVLSRLDELHEKWRDGAARELLALFNREWNPTEHALSPDEFRARLSLQGLDFRDDGSARVYFGQSELFTDHLVFVTVNNVFEVVDAGIEG